MYEMLILRKCVLLFHFNNVPKKGWDRAIFTTQ